ncbi:MAG TPA: efflux RND transporter permease subunit, partial [Burkholderiales bacterium]|nr:efflux RND transporter permease subunit [Burkholderiales bacterium]
KAQLNVNNRAKQVEPRLPAEVRRQGLTVEKGSSAFLQVLAFYSPDGRHDDIFISNYVTLNVLDEIKRVPGTTLVQIFGAKDYAMRIWLRPDRLATLKLAPSDVIRAVNEQNAQFAAGKVGETPTAEPRELVYSVTTKGRLSEVREFEDIILRANGDGSLLRLKDVARVELAGKDYSFLGKYNGRPATLMGVFLQPGANQLEVGEAVRKRITELSQRFPAGFTYAIPFDTTMFVEVSIREVVITLLEAMLLVFLVVFLFLQNWRATLIPFAAVPVSLIGTFAGLLLLGYSINTLTLFGMVLAIGIVVDDAIVVLENVERIMHEEGLQPRDAAIKAMKEVTSPIIAIVLVLCAVFIPIAFLGGLTGELYRQFAVTISIAVIISGFVALTLTPSLCAIVLRPQHGERSQRWFGWFNRGFARVTDRYESGVAWLIRRGGVALLLFAGMVAVTGFLWRTTPGSLVPDEDQGWYFAPVILPDGASLQRTDKMVEEVTAAIRSNPFNEHVMAFTGFDFAGGFVFRENAATIFVTQTHWDKRPMPVGALVGEFYGKTAHLKEGLAIAFPPPAIFGLGTAGGFEFYLQNRGEGGAKRLWEVSQQFIGAASQSPKIAMVNTFWRANVPQLYVDVDREKAKSLGVPLDDVFSTLAATLGSYYVNDFNKYGRTWQVLMSAEPGQRASPEDAGAIHVRSQKGDMIPLRSLARIEYTSGPGTLTRFNNLPAVQLLGGGRPGVSSGEAIAEIERIAREVLPPEFSLDWSGASFQEKRSGGTSVLVLALGALMAFLILAAQYEKWSLPLSVMLALPFGTFGALAAIWINNTLGSLYHIVGGLAPGLQWLVAPLQGLARLSNDVYFQIGLVTLLGLAAKNAILIVEYAVMKHHEGLSASAAAVEAARLRFRPILMTSLAFILGVLPLVVSDGAGAGARNSAGTGVMGGMLAATFLAIFFVPTFFKLMTDRHLTEERSSAEIKAEAGQARTLAHRAVAGPRHAPHRGDADA